MKKEEQLDIKGGGRRILSISFRGADDSREARTKNEPPPPGLILLYLLKLKLISREAQKEEKNSLFFSPLPPVCNLIYLFNNQSFLSVKGLPIFFGGRGQDSLSAKGRFQWGGALETSVGGKRPSVPPCVRPWVWGQQIACPL